MAEPLDYNGNKGFRLLSINERLLKGELLYKTALARQYAVTEKTIQRDFDDLRAYFAETHHTESEVSIKYDKTKNGYYLVKLEHECISNEEVLAICKVLLESRAFCKDELNGIITKLLSQVTSVDKKQVESIIRIEQFYYVPLKHEKPLLAPIWALSQYITKKEIIAINYTRKDGTAREHRVKPVAIMFSEYYFYLIAFMADASKDYPTVFRIDRLGSIVGTNEKFSVPYKERFNDGEFRKRVQFMYAGELRKVTFEYSGQSIESVLDRLPTAEILSEKDGLYTIKVEVYGDGIDMWLRSQGDYVKTLSF